MPMAIIIALRQPLPFFFFSGLALSAFWVFGQGLSQLDSSTSPGVAAACQTRSFDCGCGCGRAGAGAGVEAGDGLWAEVGGDVAIGVGFTGNSTFSPQLWQNLAPSSNLVPQFVQYFMAYNNALTSLIIPAHSSTTFSMVVLYWVWSVNLTSSRVAGKTFFGGGMPMLSSTCTFS